MVKNLFVKRKSFPLITLFAISLSFLFLPIKIKACPGSERIGPILQNNKTIAIRIYEIKGKNHFLRYIGIRKNDVIKEINDIEILEIYENEKIKKRISTEVVDYGHIKIKLQRKKSTYTIEFVLNQKNIPKIRFDDCNGFGYMPDPNIPKKEMFDFYEMKKIE